MSVFLRFLAFFGGRGYPWHPLGGHRDRDPIFSLISTGFESNFGNPGLPLGSHGRPFAPLRRPLFDVCDVFWRPRSQTRFFLHFGLPNGEKVSFSRRADVPGQELCRFRRCRTSLFGSILETFGAYLVILAPPWSPREPFVGDPAP